MGKRNINESGETRFNIIDVLIIAACLLLVLAALWVFDPLELFDDGTEFEAKVVYTMKFGEIDADVKVNISVGDNVFDAETGKIIGSVVSVSAHGASDGSGDAQKTQENGSLNIYIEIEADGLYAKGDGCYAGGRRIAYGENIFIRLAGFSGEGFCTEFTWEESKK